jgi:hypothetical protein
MDDLLEYTKDYFKKNEEEKLYIFTEIYTQIQYLILSSQVDPSMVYHKLDQLRIDSEAEEAYEVSELFKNLNIKLKENYGM